MESPEAPKNHGEVERWVEQEVQGEGSKAERVEHVEDVRPQELSGTGYAS